MRREGVVVSYASDELTILVLLVSSSSVEEKIYWHQKCLLVDSSYLWFGSFRSTVPVN
jgi:hypothetical protein